MKRLARIIATVLGVGYIRPAPGTWGSLVALPWGWLLHVLGGFPLLVLAISDWLCQRLVGHLGDDARRHGS